MNPFHGINYDSCNFRSSTESVNPAGHFHIRVPALYISSDFLSDPETAVSAPERRCSSRTFRYGYLVTT